MKDKHLLAIDFYFQNGFNQRKALESAGYTEKTARFQPQSVFHREDVKAEIKRRQDKMSKALELNQDWIVKRFMLRAMADEILAKFKKIQKDGTLMWDFANATEEDLALVAEFSTEFYTEGRGSNAIQVKKFKAKGVDVNAALIALARHVGLFKDSLELTGDLVSRIQAGRDRVHKD